MPRWVGYAMFAGLAYPIAICLITFVVGCLFILETEDHQNAALWRDDRL